MKRLTSLFAALAIPLTSPAGWQDLHFSKIKANRNVFSEKGLEVTVDKSSSPLIYPLKEPVMVTGFKAELEIDGAIHGFSGRLPEDAYLRMGFVVPGQRKLGMMESMMAAAWVKKLFSLAPEGSGVDKIYFFNLADGATGNTREFPGSKGLIVETIVAARDPGVKQVTFEHKLPKPLTAAALWLSVDGDDTQSSYKLNVKSLSLEIKPRDPDKSE